MKNLINKVFHSFENSNPKNIIITGMDDIKRNAAKLKKLDLEDRKMLTEYILRTEINKVRGQQSANDYNITVGKAIEKQRRFSNFTGLAA